VAQRLGQPLGGIVAEMNDPFRIRATKDNLDPFLRSQIWDKWSYRRLDFPYVQPTLSTGEEPIEQLMLIAKAFRPEWKEAVPAKQCNRSCMNASARRCASKAVRLTRTSAHERLPRAARRRASAITWGLHWSESHVDHWSSATYRMLTIPISTTRSPCTNMRPPEGQATLTPTHFFGPWRRARKV
jgi:hypothetical protein